MVEKPRERARFWNWSLCARHTISSLNLGFCLQDHALLALKKQGHKYIPCARQPITDDGAISNLGGLRSARCLMERTERRKRKQSPNASLFVFRLALSNHPQHLPAKSTSGSHAYGKWRHAEQPTQRTSPKPRPPDTPIVSANRKRAAVSPETDAPKPWRRRKDGEVQLQLSFSSDQLRNVAKERSKT